MYNPFSLKGKTILVTGASSGLGRSIAVEASKMGASLIITARNTDHLQQTYDMLEGDNHKQLIADLSSIEDIKSLVEECPELDGCVNCAGIAKLILIQFIKKESVEDIFNINTFAPILLTSLMVKKKKIKHGASIVFISAVSGIYMSSVGESLYSATKGALHGFVKGIALDLAPKGIRVNSITPGLVPTNILNEAKKLFSEDDIFEKRKKQYPLGRFGSPEDIAFGSIYLLSDASKWVTGSALLIDGGLTLNGI